ncbi:MAG: hypothetical protein JETCAE01_02080 [Anaerolineaceae bacterium]|nr:MAG: hypothetical protein JETCAE01_02080 [Anaerolineaceae bacterium]
MNKSALLVRLQNERDQFELLLNRVGFARRLTLRGVSGGLTVKDLLAEALSHELFIADRLTEILHGEAYSPSASFSALENFQKEFGYPDYESPLVEKHKHNWTVLNAYKNIEFDEIVAEELAVYASIVELLEKLSHHQFLDHDLFHRIAEHTYRPYRRAGSLIHAWLGRIAAEPK